MIAYINKFLFGLSVYAAKFGDSIAASEDATEAITGANGLVSYFIRAAQIAGVIILALGLFKFITALADHSPMGKINATTMVVLGGILVTANEIQTVIETASNGLIVKGAGLENNISSSVLVSVLELFTTPLTVVGVVLICIGLFQIVLSIVSERPEEKVESSKLIAIGAVLVVVMRTGSSIVKTLSRLPNNTGTAESKILDIALNSLLAPVMEIVGATMLAFGLLKFALAMKDEDSNSKVASTKFIVTGAILCLARVMFGTFI